MSDGLPTPYPILYTVDAHFKDFPHKNVIYENIPMRLFKHYETEALLDYAALIAATDAEHSEFWSDHHYAKDFINADLFTHEEVESLRRYFARYPEVSLSADLFTAFPVSNVISVGAVAVGGSSDFWMFDQARDFDCPVRFWGYYHVDGHRRSADIKTIHCRPNGLVVFDGANGFTLTSGDIDTVRAALGKAVITEEVQTIRLKLPVPHYQRPTSWPEEDLPF